MPTIVVINESTVISNADIQKMLPAFEQQWNHDLKSVWQVEQASMSFLPKQKAPASGTWWLVFLDDSDQASALAYHDLTNDGYPISKVFVKTLQAQGASVTVGATHELCEMAVDPWLNGAYQDPSGTFWAAEICDPVESDKYGYKIGDILVTDFVTPNWYAHPQSQANIDFKGYTHSAFEVLSGGYAQKFDVKSGWVQITGSAVKDAKAHAAVGSRRERRVRQSKQNLHRSEVIWNRN
jgi:hypothetical protein